MADAAEGVRAIVRNRDLELFIGLGIAQTFTRGALTVFTVVVALDLLRTGEPGVGTLTAAVGAGAVIGSLVASLLVGSHRLARWFGIGVALWGLPIALIPAFPWEATVLIMPACVGIGNALVDVGLFTLIARLAPDAVLARVFGILESLISLAVGLGAVVASLLINLTGLRIALVAVGALCPISGGGGMAPSATPGPLYRRTGQRDHTAPRPTHAAAITATCHRTAGPRSGTSPRACRPGGISPG